MYIIYVVMGAAALECPTSFCLSVCWPLVFTKLIHVS